jgi:subtilase family serine protease
MSIRFNMTAAQQAALDQLLANQQDPSSPQYHQWLTPAQYAAQFGMSGDDLAKVSIWLSSQGFTVTAIANGGTFIMFDGTVAQAESAFATSIHNISRNGEIHFANVTNVSVPSAFAATVTAVTGLHNFRLQPRVHTSLVKPDYTWSVNGTHFVVPNDIYTVYNISKLLNAGTTGTGETIAVTGQVDIYPADIAAFRSAAGLSANPPTTIHAFGYDPGPPLCNACTNEPSQGDLDESSIDVEWSGAMAPSATILFVNGDGALPNAMAYAIDNDLAPIVTTSYGLCEAAWGYTEMVAMNALFQEANAAGQTVLAAAADTGAADCDAGASAMEGLQVDFPGSSPYVTSMGATQFNDGNATGATTYWSNSNGVGQSSVLSYIPESPWDEESSFDLFEGSGGGASAFFAKPAWQKGTGVPADGARDVPDLALDGAVDHDGLLYCVNVAQNDSCTSGFEIASGTDAGDLAVAGGTSFDSQIFGGLLALVEQKTASKGVGNANPMIYALANDAAYYTPGQNTSTLSTVVFNDVTTGNNRMPCIAGSPNCPNGGEIGYSAGSGYDLASGWGSPNVYNLANAWGTVAALGVGSLGPDFSVTALAQPTPSSVASGATVTLTATVTGYVVTSANPRAGTITTSAGPTPTGTVTFLANNVIVGSGTLNASGVATYSWVTSCSYLGQQILSASYSGDLNNQGSIGPVLTANGATTTSNGSSETTPVEIQITSTTCPTYTVSTPTPTVTVGAGGAIPGVTITVTPSNGFTGTVTFSATTTSNNSGGYAPILTFSPATLTISSTAAVSTTLQMSGITADLRLPSPAGHVDSGIRMAQHDAGRSPWYAGTGSAVAIASLVLLVLPRRRRLGGLLVLALAVALIGGTTGCGGSSQAGPPSGGSTGGNPYAGTYNVTIDPDGGGTISQTQMKLGDQIEIVPRS